MDSATVNMSEGEGVVVLPAKNGVVWIAVRKGQGSEYLGNAFKPDAARVLAQTILGEADEVDRRMKT